MLVLPDRWTPRTKFFLPVPRASWQRAGEKCLWVVKAKTHDGAIVWRGVFEDREDADAFLWAIATGSLKHERELWHLCSPSFPGLPDGLRYEFLTFNVLTTTGGATYNVPSDYVTSGSTIHCIAGGGSGGAGVSGGARTASGGGGGAYSASSNIALTPGGTASYTVGTGGTAVSTAPKTNGNAGADTTFNTTTIVAKAGAGGIANDGGGSSAGASGGLASGGTGTVKFDGGSSGTASGGTYSATGGGGAAGPSAAGSTSVDTTNVAGAGGAGAGGAGGSGGSAGGGTGGNGSDITGSGVGSGGGGGGRISGTPAGTGGNYGAGGGGEAHTSAGTSGAGMQGVIVVEYIPFTYASVVNGDERLYFQKLKNMTGY